MAKKKRAGKIIAAVWIGLGVLFFLGLTNGYRAKNFDRAALENGGNVDVYEDRAMIRFVPTTTAETVLIFYPGAMVDPKAYAPLCHEIAVNGTEAVIVKMPGRNAGKGIFRMDELELANDSAKRYILAGHSKGGAAAAEYVHERPGVVDALVLIGTTHPRDFSLADCGIPVLKILASNDGVASPAKSAANNEKLPDDTRYLLIEGGNHAGFGYYGPQMGDGRATLTKDEQRRATSEAILTFIAELP